MTNHLGSKPEEALAVQSCLSLLPLNAPVKSNSIQSGDGIQLPQALQCDPTMPSTEPPTLII